MHWQKSASLVEGHQIFFYENLVAELIYSTIADVTLESNNVKVLLTFYSPSVSNFS